MKYVTRAATMADVPRLREVEMRTLPHFTWYTTECAPLFIEQKGQRGEMVVAERLDLPADDPERIIGIGQYSIMPDGSGWMECLRILPEFQRTGAGRQIYERYQELWNETDAPHVAMFTDLEGFASKSLAELYGFRLAGTYDEYKLLLEGVEAEIGEEGVTLRYDGFLLDTGAVLGNLSPLEAFPLLIRCWQSGCVTACWRDNWDGEACLAAEFDLTEAGEGETRLCRSYFRAADGLPLGAELLADGYTVLSCRFLSE